MIQQLINGFIVIAANLLFLVMLLLACMIAPFFWVWATIAHWFGGRK